MKKELSFIMCLIILFSAVGCIDNNTSSIPVGIDNLIPESSTGSEFKEDATESEDSSSSSSGLENKPPEETEKWTGFF